jgi:hypothetical protein
MFLIVRRMNRINIADPNHVDPAPAPGRKIKCVSLCGRGRGGVDTADQTQSMS